MPRTLDPTLEAALNSGNFTPYFLLTVREVGGNILETATPVQFKLSGINLTAKWQRLTGCVYEGFNYPQELEFKVTRGVTILGINYTLDSSYYYGITQSWDGVFQSVTASMLPETKYTAAGDVTYKTVIDAICTNYGKTAVYRTIGAAWQSYKFLGAGKVINLNRANDIINMLKQKYLIYACDNGNNEILFSAIGTESAGSADFTKDIGLISDYGANVSGYRRFLWRDELGTVHYDGNTNDPLWNLGYLEVATAPPTTNFSFPFTLKPIAPHLIYLTFDTFTFNFEKNYPQTPALSITTQMQIEEEFNYSSNELAWRINLTSFHWSKGTEGGSLPGTIEAAAPYTPLNTSNFDTLLSTNDNNIQAALDTLDDHTHTSISDHLTDTSDAHDASAVSIVDTGGYFTGTDVEAALQELGAGGSGGGLTYTATTVTTSNVSAANGNLYVCSIGGMTADRDFNLPTPAAAGERIGILILDGDDTYELLIKANSTEITRLFIPNEYMTFLSTGTGAGDWEIEVDGRIPSLGVMERQAAQSINNTTVTIVDFDTAVSNVGNIADITNNVINIRRAGKYIVIASGVWENAFSDQKSCQTLIYIGGVLTRYQVSYVSIAGSSKPNMASLIYEPQFTAGQQLDMRMWQDTGVAINTGTTVGYPHFVVQEVLP